MVLIVDFIDEEEEEVRPTLTQFLEEHPVAFEILDEQETLGPTGIAYRTIPMTLDDHLRGDPWHVFCLGNRCINHRQPYEEVYACETRDIDDTEALFKLLRCEGCNRLLLSIPLSKTKHYSLKLSYQDRMLELENNQRLFTPDGRSFAVKTPTVRDEMEWLLIYADQVEWSESEALEMLSTNKIYAIADEPWRAYMRKEYAFHSWCSEYDYPHDEDGIENSRPLYEGYCTGRDDLARLLGEDYQRILRCTYYDTF